MKQAELETLIKEFTNDENVLDFSGLNEKINKEHINDVIAKGKPDMEKLEVEFKGKLLKELGLESFDDIKTVKSDVDDKAPNELQEKYDKLLKDFEDSNKAIKASNREKLLKDVGTDEFKEFISFKLDSMITDELDEATAFSTLKEDETYSKYFSTEPKIKSTGKEVVKTGTGSQESELLEAYNKRHK